MLAKSGTLARRTIAATPRPTQRASHTLAGRLAPIPAFATTRVMAAMMAPAALFRIVVCRPDSFPPLWKKAPHAMKAAQMANAPPSGPRKSHVAMAPNTPRLIAKAVFKDISPPLLHESGWTSALPADHRLYRAKACFWIIRFGFRTNHNRNKSHLESTFHIFAQISRACRRVFRETP